MKAEVVHDCKLGKYVVREDTNQGGGSFMHDEIIRILNLLTPTRQSYGLGLFSSFGIV